MAVSLPDQDRLASAGFSIASGNWFTDQSVKLYTHRDTGTKKVGEIALTVHVDNPRSLNDYESHQFARKAEFGFFPWEPGETCLAREFTKVSRVPRPGGGFTVVRGEKVMGCKWCRTDIGSQGAVTGETQKVEPFPVESAVTPPAPADSLKCEQCNFTTLKGEAGMKVHASLKHASTRKSRTRKGTGRRSK